MRTIQIDAQVEKASEANPLKRKAAHDAIPVSTVPGGVFEALLVLHQGHAVQDGASVQNDSSREGTKQASRKSSSLNHKETQTSVTSQRRSALSEHGNAPFGTRFDTPQQRTLQPSVLAHPRGAAVGSTHEASHGVPSAPTSSTTSLAGTVTKGNGAKTDGGMTIDTGRARETDQRALAATLTETGLDKVLGGTALAETTTSIDKSRVNLKNKLTELQSVSTPNRLVSSKATDVGRGAQPVSSSTLPAADAMKTQQLAGADTTQRQLPVLDTSKKQRSDHQGSHANYPDAALKPIRGGVRSELSIHGVQQGFGDAFHFINASPQLGNAVPSEATTTRNLGWVQYGSFQATQTIGDLIQSNLSAGGNVLTVQVHPEGLGNLQISVTRSDSGVHVQVLTENELTMQWLHSLEQPLLDTLRAAGVNANQVNVQMGNQTSQFSGEGHQDREEKGRRAHVVPSASRNVSSASMSGADIPYLVQGARTSEHVINLQA